MYYEPEFLDVSAVRNTQIRYFTMMLLLNVGNEEDGLQWYCKSFWAQFDVILTVYPSIDLFQLPP